MKKYSVIYADPPWRYRVYSKKGLGRSAESHYPTMSLEDIKALPIGELAAKDCVLFMWITFPCMQEALQVLEAWGFEYKTTAFVWIKQNRVSDGLFWGMGYWTRANAELCILATKGHPKRASPGSAALSFSFGIFSFVSRQKKSTSQYHFFNRQHQNSFCPQRLQFSYNLPEALFIQHRMY